LFVFLFTHRGHCSLLCSRSTHRARSATLRGRGGWWWRKPRGSRLNEAEAQVTTKRGAARRGSHTGYTSPLDACQCSAHALARPHSGIRTRIHGQGRRRDERAGTNRDASLRSRLRARRARCRWLTSWPLGGSGCVLGGSLGGKRLCRRQLRTCTCCDEQQADRVRGIPHSILGGQRGRRVTTHASIVNNGPIPHSSTMAGARPHRRGGVGWWLGRQCPQACASLAGRA